MSDKFKKAPVYIKPDRGVIGHDTLMITEGPDTYVIDLKAFIEVVPVSVLREIWTEAKHAEDPTVRERLRAAGWKDPWPRS